MNVTRKENEIIARTFNHSICSFYSLHKKLFLIIYNQRILFIVSTLVLLKHLWFKVSQQLFLSCQMWQWISCCYIWLFVCAKNHQSLSLSFLLAGQTKKRPGNSDSLSLTIHLTANFFLFIYYVFPQKIKVIPGMFKNIYIAYNNTKLCKAVKNIFVCAHASYTRAHSHTQFQQLIGGSNRKGPFFMTCMYNSYHQLLQFLYYHLTNQNYILQKNLVVAT